MNNVIDSERMALHSAHAARLLKSLANEKRLQILCCLHEHELSVGELNARIDLSQSALSQHLALLREEGLVGTRREAQTIYYRMLPGPARALIQTLHSLYCAES